MLEREEKKKRRQKLEKLRQQRERGTSPRTQVASFSDNPRLSR